MKSSVFWDITSCSPLKMNRRFGGAFHLHLQGQISLARNQHEVGSNGSVSNWIRSVQPDAKMIVILEQEIIWKEWGKLAEAVMLLTCIREAPSCSTLDRGTDYHGWGFSWISSVPPDRCQDATTNYATISSFHILSSSHFILPFDAIWSEMQTASLNKPDFFNLFQLTAHRTRS
jgi:hypothetical protein